MSNLTDQATQEQIALRKAGLQTQFAEFCGQLDSLVGQVEVLAKEGVTQLGNAEQAIAAQVRADREAAIQIAQEQSLQAQEEIVSRLTTAIAKAAPGSAGAPWTGWELPEQGEKQSAVADAIRFGSVLGSEGSIPALAPLLTTRGWYLTGPEKLTEEMILAAVLRLLPSLPLKHLRILAYDPKLRGALGPLAPLRNAHGDSFPPPCNLPEQFRTALEEAMVTAARNVEMIANHGAKDLFDLWGQLSVPDGTAVLVIVLDYPSGVDDELRKMLHRVVEAGGPAGLTLLVQGPAQPTEQSGDPIEEKLTNLINHEGLWYCNALPEGFAAESDGDLPREIVSATVGHSVAAVANIQGPTHPLEELIGSSLTAPWQKNSTHSLDAIIGRVGQDLLTLSLRSENPLIRTCWWVEP